MFGVPQEPPSNCLSQPPRRRGVTIPRSFIPTGYLGKPAAGSRELRFSALQIPAHGCSIRRRVGCRVTTGTFSARRPHPYRTNAQAKPVQIPDPWVPRFPTRHHLEAPASLEGFRWTRSVSCRRSLTQKALDYPAQRFRIRSEACSTRVNVP